MARAEPASALAVEVRAAVAETPKSTGLVSAAPLPPGFGKRYGIFSVQLVDSERDLVSPVDEDDLTARLVRELDAHGFRQITKDEIPEILLTVHFGRGWIANPYKGGRQTVIDMTNQTANVASAPSRIVSSEVVDFRPPVVDGTLSGREAKLQKGNYEKLYVRVTAWEFPRDPAARAHMLWRTTMFTDDPDHRDLNEALPTMLAAGAPYFGRKTAVTGVEIFPPVAEGHVTVGTPQVVDAPVAASVPSRVPPVAPAPVAAEPRKRFAVSAGTASETLRTFARQSDERIIYPVEEILAVKTNAVAGEFSPRVALEMMLRGTGLVVVRDEKTGTFIVQRMSR